MAPYLVRAAIWYTGGRKTYGNAGYNARVGDFRKEDLEVDLTDKCYIVTGGNSGIGKEVAIGLASRRACVFIACRDQGRAEAARKEIVDASNNDNVHFVQCDLSDHASVRSCAAAFAGRPVHGLVNNAGCMVNDQRTDSSGFDVNFSTNVLGTFLLTELLIPHLRAVNGRVITVASGGCLTERLKLENLHHRRHGGPNYNGTRAYAHNKRCQLELTHVWAETYPEVSFYTMHPGWADTPAVRSSMPGFYEKNKAMFRTAQQGADTALWLVASRNLESIPNGSFCFDREVTLEHLGGCGTQTPLELRPRLYAACCSMVGLGPAQTALAGHLTRDFVDDVWNRMTQPHSVTPPGGLQTKTHSSMPRCATGTTIVDWISKHFSVTRLHATETAQLLQDMGRLMHTGRSKLFQDTSSLYFQLDFPARPPMEVVTDAWLDSLLSFIDDDTRWSPVESKVAVDRVFTADFPESSGLKVIKVDTTFHAPCSLLVRLLHTQLTERHGEWNETYAEGRVLDTQGDDASTQLWRYKPGKGVTPREFVVAHRRFVRDQCTILADTSVDHPANVVGSNPSYLRCQLPFNIRRFSPGDEPGTTRLTYVNLTDLKGWLPTWMCNSLNPTVSVEEIEHIRKIVEDEATSTQASAAVAHQG